MKVRDIMTPSVSSVQFTDSIANVAQAMADFDVGALPVLEGRKLVGIVTDRDVAVRAVAAGINVERPITSIMSDPVITCGPDAEIEDALETMSDEQIRRLPVCDGDGDVVGIVALADAARRDPDKAEVTEALEEICEPSGLHCQPAVFA